MFDGYGGSGFVLRISRRVRSLVWPFEGVEGSRIADWDFWEGGSVRGVFFAVQRIVYQRSQRRDSVLGVLSIALLVFFHVHGFKL